MQDNALGVEFGVYGTQISNSSSSRFGNLRTWSKRLLSFKLSVKMASIKRNFVNLGAVRCDKSLQSSVSGDSRVKSNKFGKLGNECKISWRWRCVNPRKRCSELVERLSLRNDSKTWLSRFSCILLGLNWVYPFKVGMERFNQKIKFRMGRSSDSRGQ